MGATKAVVHQGHPLRPDLKKSAPKDLEEAQTQFSSFFRSVRCFPRGEQKETEKTKNDGGGFEFAVRGIAKPQLF
jgi:hypothetical protein